MEESVFRSHFPDFPKDPGSLQKLGVLLRGRKIYEKDSWDKLRSEVPDPDTLILAIAAKEGVTVRDLAEVEATLLNVPFIDLEATQIASEILKIIGIPQMCEHKVIPIKIDTQELLVGMLSPGNQELIAKITPKTPLAIKPAKVIWEHLESRLNKMTHADKPTKAPVKKGPRKKLGDILVESKLITDEQLKKAIDDSKKEKQRLGAYLVKQNLISNKQLSVALSKQFDIPFFDLDESLVDPVLATLLPKKLCYDQILCPVKREDSKLVLAMTDPTDIITIDHVEMMTGMRISPVVSSELSIVSALGKLYGESMDSLAENIGKDTSDSESANDELGSMGENDAPIIKLVNLVLTQAVQMGASDIHIEAFEKDMRIRLRKDGVLKLHMTPTKSAHAGVVSRIKIMANLDIAETRLPQDGRIKLNLQNRKVDLRVSSIPCVWGEKVVMRLLDQGNLKVNLSDLGFEPHVLDTFMAGVKQPHGIVLVTGPTGSGKTTTLYSSLFLLNNPSVNIMTAEDPVEYNLMGINQVQCHAEIGLDFGAALRSFLRQDPNVIMLGEIRDFETANIAIKAAMTGHLVISTLHTNDAPSTVARLLNMGIEPFSLATALRIVEAQRLVRRICKSCRTEYKPAKDVIQSLGISPRVLKKLQLDLNIDDLKFAKGAGCPDCDHTGLVGRQGIYEVLNMTAQFRLMIERRATTEEMRKQAMADGMLSLRESALYKLITQKTSVEEVFKATMDDEDSTNEAKGIKSVKPVAAPTTSIGEGVSVAGIQDLTTEIQAFRSAIESLKGHSKAITIENEVFKKGLIDPLASMKSQLGAVGTAEDLSKIMPSIHAQSQKMDFNLCNMASFFSPLSFKPAKVQINQLVEALMVNQLKHHVVTARLLSGQASIGQGLKVTKSLGTDLPLVRIDPEAFKIIVSNLVVNSLIALAGGGEIKLLTRTKPQTADKVEVVMLDSGPGIPEDQQSKLFQPFSPIGRKTLGLGLSVTRKILDSIGGEIDIKSVPGKSTIVTVSLPVAI